MCVLKLFCLPAGGLIVVAVDFLNARTMVPFSTQLPPTWLPPVHELVSLVPEAGPSTIQSRWAPSPVLHVPSGIKPITHLPGVDQMLQGPPEL